MRLFILATISTALASFASGLVVDDSHSLYNREATPKYLFRRNNDCVSVHIIQDWLKKHTMFGNKPTIFYTGDAKAIDTRGVASQLNGLWWGDLMTHDQQLDWIGACKTPEAQDLVIPRIAEATALESIAAYVVMKGSRLGKIWVQNELPALKKKGIAVQKLVPGGKPVPYGDGSPPPSRSPSPAPASANLRASPHGRPSSSGDRSSSLSVAGRAAV